MATGAGKFFRYPAMPSPSFVHCSHHHRTWPVRVLLMLLCLALYLPGLTTIPPVDRDEPRFAQATKQMLESGDFIRPHFQADTRFNKPIGIYWLQAAAVSLTRPPGSAPIWTYRLPSVLGACVAVLLTYWVGCLLFDRSVAALGAACLASSALLVVEAHLATTDAVLLACVAGAQGCLAALYAAAQRGGPGLSRHAAGFWLAQGLGILIKGPIVPLLSGLTFGALALADRRATVRLRPALRAVWGVPLMSAVILPWILAVGWATNWAFFRDWIGGDLLPKLTSGHESHGAPPGVYVLLLIVTFWPGSFAVGLGMLRGIAQRDRYAERFCLAWVIPAWLFFELMPTKLPHYVLPTYPALALLAAASVFDPPALLSRTARNVMRSGFVLWGLLTLAAGAAVAATAMLLGGTVAAASALASGVIGIAVVRLCWSGHLVRASLVAVLASVLLFAPALQWVLPRWDTLWLSRGMAAAIARQAGGVRPLVAVGYYEPSLIFLHGDGMTLVEPQRAATFLKEQSHGLVLLSDDQQAAFEQAAGAVGVRLRELWSVEGFNYSKGERTRLHLFEHATG